jgi:hypothetical protein
MLPAGRTVSRLVPTETAMKSLSFSFEPVTRFSKLAVGHDKNTGEKSRDQGAVWKKFLVRTNLLLPTKFLTGGNATMLGLTPIKLTDDWPRHSCQGRS